MFVHYSKIALRNMWKYKAQSFTAILGLALGLTCFVPALFWLRYETSYDSFYPGSEHIYRIYAVDRESGKVDELISGVIERSLHEQFAATENSTIFFIKDYGCKSGKISHIRLNTLFADSTFFHVFPQVFVSGDARGPLQVLNNIVLTESVALRLFGDVEKAIGQQIQSTEYDWHTPCTVTAVVKDPPPNTNLMFDAILCFEEIEQHKSFVTSSVERMWQLSTLQGYVKFHPNTDVNTLKAPLRDFLLTLDANTKMELRLLPVSDVRYRLNTDVPFTLNFIRLFVIAGILLIFCAIFNFLSVFLGIFHQRVRELHLRSVHGASGGGLFAQMMFELAYSAILALVLACGFIVCICPVFSNVSNIAVETSQLMHLFVLCSIGVMMIIWLVCLLPFWQFSRLAIQNLAKSKRPGGPLLQRLAISFQLAVSIAFIVAALVAMMQMRFVNRKDLGFARTGIIQLSGLSDMYMDRVGTAFLKELASIPQLENITNTDFEAQHNTNIFNSEIENTITQVEWPGKQQAKESHFHLIYADSQFAEVFGLKMAMGEWYNEVGARQIVLNQEAVREMDLSEPIGTVIRLSSGEYKVVGVVKDFHTLSLRNRMQPTLFVRSKYMQEGIYARVVPGQENEAIQRINALLPKIDASLVDVSPTTLNEVYNRLNRSEQAGLQVFLVLSIVCLLVSLFGIYAIAAAASQRRRKEIAIRKVAGAQVGDIVRIFFSEYSLQVMIAGLIALPPAYLFMSRWLQGYAYRTTIPWWLLAAVIAGVVAIVLATVCKQILKAANNNPADEIKAG